MDDVTPQGVPDIQANNRYETKDAKVRAIALAAGVLVVSAVVLHVALWLLLRSFAAHPEKPETAISPLALSAQVLPEPHLEIAPPQDLSALQAAQSKILNSYGWVDKSAGRVRIPIERAKDLFLEQNTPETANTAPTGGRTQ